MSAWGVLRSSGSIDRAGGSVDAIWCTMLGICQKKSYIPSAFRFGRGMTHELLLQNTCEAAGDTSGTNSSDHELQDVNLLLDVVQVDSAFFISFSGCWIYSRARSRLAARPGDMAWRLRCST